MKKSTLRNILLTGLAYVAYRAYNLYQLGESFTYRVKSIYFRRPKTIKDALSQFEIIIEYTISNPTNTSMKMNGLYGKVFYKEYEIANYRSGAFTIKPGDVTISVSMFVTPAYAAVLLRDVTQKNFPVFNTSLTAVFPFGIRYTQKFDINTKDYLPENVVTLFQ